MNNTVVDQLREGVLYVVRRPLRSLLSAVTCAVAIAVTVNVISLNYGLDEDIRGDISQFGRRTIDVGRTPLIRPGAARAPFGDAELAKVRDAVKDLGAAVVPVRQQWVTARGGARVARLSLAAVTPEYQRSLSIPVVAGRWFNDSEHGLAACVLDKSAAEGLFPNVPLADMIGKAVTLEGEPERAAPVVGILEDPMTYRALFEAFDENKASRTLTSALLAFRNVYVPEDAIATADLSLVSVVLPDDAKVTTAAERLKKLWSASDQEKSGDELTQITVFVRRDWMDAIGGTTQMGAFLGNIVWILIVLVACIMISTLNLITIRERYDELAIRRCEGARKSQLALQVTAEGVLVSLAGGILGLPLGYAGAAALKHIVDFPFRFEARYAVPAIGISLLLGLLASVVPARRAAGLDPARVLTRRLT